MLYKFFLSRFYFLFYFLLSNTLECIRIKVIIIDIANETLQDNITFFQIVYIMYTGPIKFKQEPLILIGIFLKLFFSFPFLNAPFSNLKFIQISDIKIYTIFSARFNFILIRTGDRVPLRPDTPSTFLHWCLRSSLLQIYFQKY